MSETTPPQITNGQERRRKLLFGLALLVVIALAGSGFWYLIHGRWYENTEDAYANGNIVEITPAVAGTIVEIGVDDNMMVQAGQSMVKLDPSDREVSLQMAEAALAHIVRQVRGMYSNVEGQSADLASKQFALQRAREDVERRRGLDATGAIPKEELAHAQSALDEAERAVVVAREQLATTQAMTDDTLLATHPDVRAAAAGVRQAYLNYARSILQAPVTGYVTQRSAQVGQHVNVGLPLMALVPLEQIWVDANFKETQLEHMRIGQPVEVHSDLYGSDVTYHGRVESLGIGTGSSMSLLPAQNATGNWIKIVQRVPVRIALDSKELGEHPLRIGLSMHVVVDMHDRSGPMLSRSTPGRAVYSTKIYEQQLADADARILAIIRGNSGHVVPAGETKKPS
jgi:membrane fusion protein (multidrug efflux system)